MSFESLGLLAELCRAVAAKGYRTPSPIQRKAIPEILQGNDVMGAAQTGTGKTAGFTLPLLQRLAENPPTRKGRRPLRALILTPTRELAAQVAQNVTDYSQHLPLRATVIFGGVSINPQKTLLARGVDIVTATPGRLLDHAVQGSIDLSSVEILVLDEADRMLDMGFIHDIRKILALLPRQKQTLLFSATFSKEIRALSKRLLDRPAVVEVARQNSAADAIRQCVYHVDKSRKRELLSWLIGSRNWQQVLVFTRTKHGANRLTKQLVQDGITAAAIHGNKSQGARTRALAGFKAGDLRVLVATDIAARGIDIQALPHVVNFELPNVAEDYVHRIGRTGRAGKAGEAVSLVCVDEHKLLADIEKCLQKTIPATTLEGFEPDPSIRPETVSHGKANQKNASSRNRRPAYPRKNRRSGASRRNTVRAA